MRSATASSSVSSTITTRVRRPFRDNPRLILAGIGVLLGALVGILVLADRGSRLAPDFLAEGVLYALSVTNIMMLLGLVFVLARNIIKLLVERRRAIPFVRFRAKLVFILLGMTLIPAVLVLIVGTILSAWPQEILPSRIRQEVRALSPKGIARKGVTP